MFGLGLPEIIIILVVALLVVGPSKLPELARSLGKAFNDFKRMAEDVKETFNDEVEEVTKEVDEIKRLDFIEENEVPNVKEEIVLADSEAENREEGPGEGHVSAPQHSKEDESKEHSGKNDIKAT